MLVIKLSSRNRREDRLHSRREGSPIPRVRERSPLGDAGADPDERPAARVFLRLVRVVMTLALCVRGAEGSGGLRGVGRSVPTRLSSVRNGDSGRFGKR